MPCFVLKFLNLTKCQLKELLSVSSIFRALRVCNLFIEGNISKRKHCSFCICSSSLCAKVLVQVACRQTMRSDCFKLYLMAFEDLIHFLTRATVQNLGKGRQTDSKVLLCILITAVISHNEKVCVSAYVCVCAREWTFQRGGWAPAKEGRDRRKVIDRRKSGTQEWERKRWKIWWLNGGCVQGRLGEVTLKVCQEDVHKCSLRKRDQKMSWVTDGKHIIFCRGGKYLVTSFLVIFQNVFVLKSNP